ncbi:MAG: putative methyltransferase [Gemmatimonadetes bacterium]|nr:putative methyltransferase [Gemmatimonadota bacterium]
MGHRGDADVITLLVGPGTLRSGAEIALPASESHHFKVRRGRGTERVRLVDGQGVVAEGHLASPDRVTVDSLHQVARPAPLVLAVGTGDKERWGWLAEKAAEVGVTDLIPLETERTAGVASRLRVEHLDRLRRRALEAIKQSGSAWAPAIHDPTTVAGLCRRPADGARWIADVAGEPPGPGSPGSALLVAVGPEGGFADGERRQLLEAGYLPVRLGPHVLRFETAAIAAAVVAGVQRPEGRER